MNSDLPPARTGLSETLIDALSRGDIREVVIATAGELSRLTGRAELRFAYWNVGATLAETLVFRSAREQPTDPPERARVRFEELRLDGDRRNPGRAPSGWFDAYESENCSVSDFHHSDNWRPFVRSPRFEVWWDGPGETTLPTESASRQLCGCALLAACELRDELHRRQLEALAEFAAGAGHEINNPLGSIIGRAAQLRKSERDPERQRQLDTLGAQAYRIRDMIGDAMLFARPPAPRCEETDVTAMLHEVADRLAGQFAGEQVSLSREIVEGLRANVDRVPLSVAVSEVLRNALQATPPDGTVRLIANAVVVEHTGPMLRIAVADRGAGFTDEQRVHCFNPFYSGRQAGRGLGFGLSKAWRIAQQHGGDLRLLETPGETRFELLLPASGRMKDEG